MANKLGRFVGKVAVLSGSTYGIGLAIARRLGQEGAKVVVSSRNVDNVSKAVESLKKEHIDATGVQCHATNKEQRSNLIQKAIEQYGGIDMLVCNAGVNPYIGYIADCPEEAFEKLLQVNVMSPFLLSKEVIPYMKERGGGSILLMSSIIAYRQEMLIAAYGTSKICLPVLAKSFAKTFAMDNIRVNCVAPGPIDTNFMSKISKTKDYQKLLENEIPMRRMGTVEEVAGPAAFLLSDDASFITGETLIIAGGMQSRI